MVLRLFGLRKKQKPAEPETATGQGQPPVQVDETSTPPAAPAEAGKPARAAPSKAKGSKKAGSKPKTKAAKKAPAKKSGKKTASKKR